jgi:hypothetical protein
MSDIQAAAERLLTEKHYNYWECNWKTNAASDAELVAKHCMELRQLVSELYEADMRVLNCQESEIVQAICDRGKIMEKLYEACGLGGDE